MAKPTPVHPFLLLLLCLPLVGMAQGRPSPPFSMKQFDPPGRWQVGVKLETIPYQHEGSLLNPGLLVGYQLHSRLSLQVGVTPSEPSEMNSIQPNRIVWEEPASAMLLHYRAGWYIPLLFRYVITNPSRRFQLYARAGIHTYLASLRQATYYKANGWEAQIGQWEKKSHSGLGASLGVGVQVTLGKHFLLYTEASASQAWQANTHFNEASTHTIQSQSEAISQLGAGAGLLYLFK